MDEKPASCRSNTQIVVLGGGLAGMAAACHLLDAGYQVTLVEKRPFLGGRAFSFFYPFSAENDQPSATASIRSSGPATATTAAWPNLHDETAGFQVDNGQHVFLGCCSYYIDFLKKLGTFEDTYIQPQLRMKIVGSKQAGKATKVGYLASVGFLPSPLHLMPSFFLYPHLGIKDKVMAVYGLIRVILAKRSDPQLEQQSFYGWLKDHGQTDRAIENFWNLIIIPTLNDHSKDVSAAAGLMVYQDGVLKSRTSSSVGYSTVGLSNLMGDAAKEYFLSKGGKLVLGKRVTRINLEKEPANSVGADVQSPSYKVSGVELTGGDVLEGDLYLSALTFNSLHDVLPDQLASDPFFRGTKELSTSPIVNIHVWYDRPVMEPSSTPFVAFLDSPLQWVFDKSTILGSNNNALDVFEGQYICISVSGAWDYVNVPKGDLKEIFLTAMAEAFPKAAEAQVKQFLVVKSAATFRCGPGSAQLRPGPTTPVKNLFLAGDWTDTGWPSTMEGAVRSGFNAVQAIKSSTPVG